MEGFRMANIRQQLIDHIEAVSKLISLVREELFTRAEVHDTDKFNPSQFERHEKFVPKLAVTEYGSKEYFEQLKELAPALEEHYQINPHHPEHFPSRGIRGMNLIDLMEMMCDWLASTKRQKNGDIFKSIEINQKRFGYSDELKDILENTAMFLIRESL
jgi:hypothetical protein